jgi:hypothetical protein
MQPDYTAMVNEFIRPVVSLFLFVFLILGWLMAFRLMKENTILRIKLGKEDEMVSESFKTWMLRKSAPMVLPIYNFKASLREKQFYPVIKKLSTKKVLKLALRFGVVTSVVSNIFGIDTTSVR